MAKNTKPGPETEADEETKSAPIAKAKPAPEPMDTGTDADDWNDEDDASEHDNEGNDNPHGEVVDNPADTETDVENEAPVSGLSAMVEARDEHSENIEMQKARESVRQEARSRALENVTDDESARLEQGANLNAKAKEASKAREEIRARIGGAENFGAPGVAASSEQMGEKDDAQRNAVRVLKKARAEDDGRDGWRNSVELGIPVADLKKMVADNPEYMETGNAPGGHFSPDTGILFRAIKR